MIKLSNLLLVGLMVSFLLPTTEMTAQTRQGTTKTAASTKKSTPAAKTVNLDGYYYEGILKMKGQPMDFFSTLKFTSSEVNFDLAGAAEIPAEYKASEAGGKMTVKLISPAFTSATLISKDKGSTLEGSVGMQGQTLQVWYLKVNSEHTIPSMTDEDLISIIENPDGYTAFVIGEQGGQRVCFTADMELNNTDKTYSVSFDNPTVQKVFSKLQGKYSVENKTLTLSDESGTTRSGEIYDDGTYISVPMGYGQGFNFTLLMIR